MKIRMGFVSNSSTSSFLIYGVILSHEECKEIFKSKGNYFDPYDIITEEKTGLIYSGLPECEDGYCIGRSWGSVKDDENGKQFKEDVKVKLTKLGITHDPETHERAWYNG